MPWTIVLTLFQVCGAVVPQLAEPRVGLRPIQPSHLPEGLVRVGGVVEAAKDVSRTLQSTWILGMHFFRIKVIFSYSWSKAQSSRSCRQWAAVRTMLQFFRTRLLSRFHAVFSLMHGVSCNTNPREMRVPPQKISLVSSSLESCIIGVKITFCCCSIIATAFAWTWCGYRLESAPTLDPFQMRPCRRRTPPTATMAAAAERTRYRAMETEENISEGL